MSALVNSRQARWLRVAGLVATLSSACNGDTSLSPTQYDAYYQGAWQLTGILDSLVDTGSNVPRTPRTEEARTWHVFSSEGYVADTARALATVEWGGRSGTGYWYLWVDQVRLSAVLTRPSGDSEVYADTLYYGASSDTTLELVRSRGYTEFYRRVGPP
jgi:hypothetical protein